MLASAWVAYFDGTRRRLALHRNGRLIRKATERISEGFEVDVLGGEHLATRSRRTEQQRMQNAASAPTNDVRVPERRDNEWLVSFFID